MSLSESNRRRRNKKAQVKSEGVPISEVQFISQATEEDRLIQQRAEQQTVEALSIIRATAEKWAATIAAVFTALGFVTFIQGREQIRALGHVFEIVAGGAVLAAFSLAAIAIVLAALAAQGTPRETAVTGPELRFIEQREALRARKRLTRSRASLGFALILVIVALGFLWYSPGDKKKSQTNVLVLTRSGDLECGSLEATGGNQLAVKSGSTVKKIQTTEVLSVSTVQFCP
jgi:hypothetical protein